MRAAPFVLTADGFVTGQADTNVVGLSFTGFTNVKLRVGGSSGDIAWEGAAGATWPYELFFKGGCYVDVTGSGSVAVWVA